MTDKRLGYYMVRIDMKDVRAHGIQLYVAEIIETHRENDKDIDTLVQSFQRWSETGARQAAQHWVQRNYGVSAK